jgi:hypothetical protein
VISPVLLAINISDAVEPGERIDALAGLLEQGDATAVYVGDFFAGIIDTSMPAPIWPAWLPPALA